MLESMVIQSCLRRRIGLVHFLDLMVLKPVIYLNDKINGPPP